MTKGELLKILEGLDDNAQIIIELDDKWYNIYDYRRKVVSKEIKNEITLICE